MRCQAAHLIPRYCFPSRHSPAGSAGARGALVGGAGMCRAGRPGVGVVGRQAGWWVAGRVVGGRQAGWWVGVAGRGKVRQISSQLQYSTVQYSWSGAVSGGLLLLVAVFFMFPTTHPLSLSLFLWARTIYISPSLFLWDGYLSLSVCVDWSISPSLTLRHLSSLST